MLLTGKDGKTCRICEEWKLFEEYRKRSNGKRRTECKSCEREQSLQRLRKREKQQVFTTLVIPDIQSPFHHKDTIPFLRAVKDKYAPDEVVSAGDELDCYWLNAYGTDPDHDNPEGEYAKAYDFWQDMFILFPNGVGVHSNHLKGRLERKRKQARIPSHFLKSIEQIIGAPEGWKWVDEHETQGTIVRHGHNDGKSAKGNLEKINHFRMFNNEKPLNLLLGHFHTEIGSKDILMGQNVAWFGFCGSLIDRHAHAFNYSNKPPALGCVLIRDGRLFPVIMKLGSDDRWVGDL